MPLPCPFTTSCTVSAWGSTFCPFLSPAAFNKHIHTLHTIRLTYLCFVVIWCFKLTTYSLGTIYIALNFPVLLYFCALWVTECSFWITHSSTPYKIVLVSFMVFTVCCRKDVCKHCRFKDCVSYKIPRYSVTKQILHMFVGSDILVNKSWPPMRTTREVSNKGCFTKAWKRKNDQSELAGLCTPWNEEEQFQSLHDCSRNAPSSMQPRDLTPCP
jgi:hypothetical protein